MTSALLGPADLRALADRLDIRPTKSLGQNFLHDANTIRRIVRAADLTPGQTVLEIGPGLGSLTLGLLEAGHPVTAVEIDPVLAATLPTTVAARLPAAHLRVVTADALTIRDLPGPPPTALVANLPYNVAVPVVLTLLARFDGLQTGLVMVQSEVAARLAAPPGSRVYGVPSVKAAWYARTSRAGTVPRAVFWPVPNVDSGLVRLVRRPPPELPAGVTREDVFAVIDAAFAQRRKTIRNSLKSTLGLDAETLDAALQAAGIDGSLRAEALAPEKFLALAKALPNVEA